MIKDEAVQRFKAAYQDECGNPTTMDDAYITRNHAVSIRALMDADKPLPVDPDLLLARKIVADSYEREDWPAMAAQALAGVRDDDFANRTALACIKAGKAMR